MLYSVVFCCTVSYCVVLCCTVLYCVVLCCTVSYCVVLYCTVLYCVVLCCIVLYCVVLCCTVLYCVVLCCIALYCVVLCRTVLYCIVPCCTVSYCVVLCCTVLYCSKTIFCYLFQAVPVSASDKDIGINADTIYYIDGPGSEQFVIDRTTAVLKTRRSPLPTLDYEKNSTHVFNIIATDQAGNGLSSSVPVTIHLIDENDNTPIFLPSVLRVSTSESTPVNDVIATVLALDSDPGLNGRVNYSIVSGAEGMFAIGEADGKLRVLHKLDREKNEVYHMNISGIDGNLYPRQGFGLVIVTLRDANDNPPDFVEPEYTTSVSEDIPVGREVVTVHAVDPDKGVNSIVTYSLDHPLFHVDNITGVLRTKVSLDRETAGSYSLSVRAADGGGLETSVTVNIVLNDVNDNSPYFPENDQYRSDVSEGTPIGTEIISIVAEDDDEGKNAVLHYSLAQSVGDLFEIDSQTGIIRYKTHSKYFIKL